MLGTEVAFKNRFEKKIFPLTPPGITGVEGKGEIDDEKEFVSDDVRITDVEKEFV